MTQLSKSNQLFKLGKNYISIKKEDPHYSWHRALIKHLKFPLDQHYGSHAIVLLAALFVLNKGPVLELGMGPTSSPLLHRLALEQNRSLVSADSDRQWIDYFQLRFGNQSFHRMKYVEVKTETGVEWSISNLANLEKWNIVFIDHRPGPRRQFNLVLYAEHSDIVIIHDTEQSALYKYEKGLEMHPYRYRFTKLKTHTDVVSKKHDEFIKRIRYLLESTPDSYYLST